jgi:hypothetical protein
MPVIAKKKNVGADGVEFILPGDAIGISDASGADHPRIDVLYDENTMTYNTDTHKLGAKAMLPTIYPYSKIIDFMYATAFQTAIDTDLANKVVEDYATGSGGISFSCMQSTYTMPFNCVGDFSKVYGHAGIRIDASSVRIGNYPKIYDLKLAGHRCELYVVSPTIINNFCSITIREGAGYLYMSGEQVYKGASYIKIERGNTLDMSNFVVSDLNGSATFLTLGNNTLANISLDAVDLNAAQAARFQTRPFIINNGTLNINALSSAEAANLISFTPSVAGKVYIENHGIIVYKDGVVAQTVNKITSTSTDIVVNSTNVSAPAISLKTATAEQSILTMAGIQDAINAFPTYLANTQEVDINKSTTTTEGDIILEIPRNISRLVLNLHTSTFNKLTLMIGSEAHVELEAATIQQLIVMPFYSRSSYGGTLTLNRINYGAIASQGIDLFADGTCALLARPAGVVFQYRLEEGALVKTIATGHAENAANLNIEMYGCSELYIQEDFVLPNPAIQIVSDGGCVFVKHNTMYLPKEVILPTGESK